MTGMVKEEILTRQTELGYFIEDGRLVFDFLLLNKDELLAERTKFSYMNVNGQEEQVDVPAGSVAYTICQVPIILQFSDESCIQIHLADSSVQQVDGHVLDLETSRHIFHRDRLVHHLVVFITF
jgi:hypothetical protein